MKYLKTEIPDVVLLEPKVLSDDRGFFMETFRDVDFKEYVGDFTFVQENHSKSSRGILRGIHYQIQQSQGKLVRVIEGEVYDVAVDLRKSSPTFGQWVGFILSAKNKKQLWIPPGFGHGFYVTSSSAEFVYKCTEYYAPEHDRSLVWNDVDIGIRWPLINGSEPILSDKDLKASEFKKAETYA